MQNKYSNRQFDLKFLEIVHLNGPNRWTYYPVVEALVDIGALEDYPSHIIPGFYEHLVAWLPSLVEHRCSYEERGGFLQRVREGTWPCHILEHVTLELQNLAGMKGGFGRARETAERGVYWVVVSAWHAEITKQALFAARELILAAMGLEENQVDYDVQAAIAQLRDMVDSLWLGPSTACIVDAAAERNIPAIRLLSKGNLVQLGYGSSSHHIWTAETDRTSAIAENIARDKELTKNLLRACGIPVPEGRVTHSPEDAWQTAKELGLPIVIKPCDGNHGRGVFIELSQREEIESAYTVALQEGSGVLVERFVSGFEHRLLVVNGELVAATRGDMISVVGNGVSSIAELIEQQINSDHRRGTSEDHPLNLIRLDSAAQLEIARQGYSADSIIPINTRVLIQRNGNHAFDVTDEVHPSIAKTAALAARVIGLDIAGIDLVVEDITKPLVEQSGAIVEVNAGPSLLMHIKPAVGKPRPVGKAIVEHLFPKKGNGRIPVIGITGSYGKTTVAHLLTKLVSLSGRRVGLASSKGLFFEHKRIDEKNSANWPAANRVLMNRMIDVAILENSFNTLLRQGLAYDSCQVGIITNIDPNLHYGFYGIATQEQVYAVMRTQVDVVTPTAAAIDDVIKEITLPSGAAILNARDSMLVTMSQLCHGEVIYFSVDPDLPSIKEHRAKGSGEISGKRAVIVRDGSILLINGMDEMVLIQLAELLPPAGSKYVVVEIENILAAIAAAWALGVSPDVMRVGIEAFGSSQQKILCQDQLLQEITEVQGL
ncbi:MAG: cyanophycin synthetase [Nitrosomonas sp.]|nr:cyanophycin synthetase [Nitrosomonas sp.]